MRTAELLTKFTGVRQKGNYKWTACCPAHDDSSPSLQITETDDRTLLHCFSGCSVEQVCAAISIKEIDLFHNPRKSQPVPASIGKRLTKEELNIELLVIKIATYDRKRGKSLSEYDEKRVKVALNRVMMESDIRRRLG